MGALECVARDLACDPKATLGEILRRYPGLLPKPLDTALSQVSGFALNEARHVEEGREPDRDEAELVLGLSAAISGYLIRKQNQLKSGMGGELVLNAVGELRLEDARPPALFLPDAKTPERFLEFFTANIRDKNTRRAYYKTVFRFSEWCEERQLFDLALVKSIHVAAHIEILQETHSKADREAAPGGAADAV